MRTDALDNLGMVQIFTEDVPEALNELIHEFGFDPELKTWTLKVGGQYTTILFQPEKLHDLNRFHMTLEVFMKDAGCFMINAGGI